MYMVMNEHELQLCITEINHATKKYILHCLYYIFVINLHYFTYTQDVISLFILHVNKYISERWIGGTQMGINMQQQRVWIEKLQFRKLVTI